MSHWWKGHLIVEETSFNVLLTLLYLIDVKVIRLPKRQSWNSFQSTSLSLIKLILDYQRNIQIGFIDDHQSHWWRPLMTSPVHLIAMSLHHNPQKGYGLLFTQSCHAMCHLHQNFHPCCHHWVPLGHYFHIVMSEKHWQRTHRHHMVSSIMLTYFLSLHQRDNSQTRTNTSMSFQ